MKTIKNQSPHRPKDMLIDVSDDDYEAILKTGEFVDINKNTKAVAELDSPDMSWTEKEIYKWIQDNKIDINYSITKHTKKWVLEKIKQK